MAVAEDGNVLVIYGYRIARVDAATGRVLKVRASESQEMTCELGLDCCNQQ